MTLTVNLTHLESVGLVRLAAVRPELEYLFHHVMIQEAAYESLLKADRRHLHRTVAETLEQLYAEHLDALAFLLGQHWRVAGEVERAHAYFIRAGEVSRKLYANVEAIAAYTEALALTTADAQRFDLLAARAAVYDVVAEREKQRADVEALLELAETLADDARRCDALLARADLYLKTEHLQSREPAERAAALARTLSDPAREGRALRCLGEGAFNRRDFPQSRAALEAAVARLREADQPGETAACLSTLALVLGELNQLPASEQAAEEAVKLSRVAGDHRQEAINLRRLAYVHIAQNQHTAALPFAEAALALNHQLGDRANECYALNMLGNIHGGLRQTERAQASYRESLEIAEAIHLQAGIQTVVWNWRGEYLRLGEHEAALTLLETQLAKAQRGHDEYLTAQFRAVQASVWAELGQFARAIELWRAALEIRERLVAPVEGALSHIGRMQVELGQFAQAQQTLSMALAQAEKNGAPQLVGSAQLAIAYAAWLQGEPDAMRSALAQAKHAQVLLSQSNDLLSVIFALTTSGRLCLALGAVDEALTYSAEAMRLMETAPELWEMEQVLFTHSRALNALSRAAEADEYLRRAYDRVMLVADKIKDEALRRSWLENIRDHRDISAAWNARHLRLDT
jgi:tetratricopeptide (TPR) repeat protein